MIAEKNISRNVTGKAKLRAKNKMENKAEIETVYTLAYVIDDPVFPEGFQVMKAVQDGSPGWWLDRGKVETLISAFKMDYTVFEACIHAGITYDQYKYFCKVHPEFNTVKTRCKSVLSMAVKRGLVKDLTAEDGAANRRWYLERRQPETYGNKDQLMPENASQVATVTHKVFADENGKVLVSSKTAEFIKRFKEESK